MTTLKPTWSNTMTAARNYSFNPFSYANKRKAKPTPTDLNAEETIMHDNVSPLNANEAPGSKRTEEKLADAIHDAASATASAAESAADAAHATADAAAETAAKVTKPGFFKTRAGRVVKGLGIVAGAGVVAGAGYLVYRGLNAATDGAVGEAIGDAAQASGDAVADAAGEVVAALFKR